MSPFQTIMFVVSCVLTISALAILTCFAPTCTSFGARWPRWVIFTAGAGLAAAGVVSVVAAWSAVWHLT